MNRTNPLFNPVGVGPFELDHRIVLAPLGIACVAGIVIPAIEFPGPKRLGTSQENMSR